MKKRIIAFLLTITLLLSVFNTGIVVSSAEVDTDVVITVLDSNGNNIDNSALSVSVTCTYRRGVFGTRTENRTVTNFGGGVFGYDYSKQSNIQYYTINATLKDGSRTYTASEQVAKNADSVVITLSDYVQEDTWETFDVYYIADGHFPESFYGYGEQEDYGPSGDDKPLLRINVNITQLRSEKYADAVLYQQNFINTDPDTYDKNIGNAYHFIPAKTSDNNDPDEAYKENVLYANKFWKAVKDCMDGESIKAFEATGLFDHYVIYCLKNQGTASSPDNHADGILVSEITDEGVTPIVPPVYVIEMYDHSNQIFGGYTNDEVTIESNPVSMDQVLDAYKTHFNQDIEWKHEFFEGKDIWRGSYTITEANGRKYRYDVKITQDEIKANGFTSSNGVKYNKMTDTYFLAAFRSETERVVQVAYILTYTDGVSDKVFYDQVTPLEENQPAVRFEGETDRENYIFQGWTLEGGDGTVLSQQEILDKYKSVNSDLTFVAVYQVAPSKYTGTVEVILDGYYYTSDATATGTKIDITTIKGANTSIYVKADGTDYIKLERTATGVYSAELLNGDYSIYYYDGVNYVLSSDQHLSINSEDRTRYIFFEYVEYNLNGGVGGPTPTLEYYDTGSAVKVSDKVPTKKGYIFAGWKDQNGVIYQAGSVLSDSIGKSYKLTAQWTDAADVYIKVTIDHNGRSLGYDTTDTKDDILLDLVMSPNVNTPYIETGHRIVINNKNHPNHSYTYSPDGADEEKILKTVYTAIAPSVTDVSKDNLYSVAVSKHNYDITSLVTKVNENGDVIIDVVLTYAPDNKDLTFEVKVDNSVPENLIPQAAIVKVMACSPTDGKWVMIVQHQNTEEGRKPGVRVDIDKATRKGTGTYPVWVTELLENGDKAPFAYRIIVTALIYPDGTIVETNWAGLNNLEELNTDLYTIDIGDVSGGMTYEGLNGAYFNEDGVQVGLLDAVIIAEGYNITFDAQGGTVNGYDIQILENQYKVPSFDGFVPVRNGGYVFDGWYYIENGQEIDAVEGIYLNSDIIYYARWKEPLTIEGMITVGGTYVQENEDGSITIQEIPDSERVNSLIVLLQKVEPNGYTDTISQQFVFLDYKQEYFYHEGRVVGYATYSFDGIADLGNEYRIQVLIHNYNATFQNENNNNASLLDSRNYPTYNNEDYYAVFGELDPKTATVNVHSHFSPQEFELKYSVNAEQIGDGFKPQQVEMLVTADGQNSGTIPSNWNVISQMIINDDLVGKNVVIKKGKGEGSNMVWIGRSDGITNYQYGLRVDSVVLADGRVVSFNDALPFNVLYQAPAYFMNGAQVGDLVATLVPKTYNITYISKIGTLSGDYPTNHTWSFETSIAGVVPKCEGFKFAGWYLDEALTQPAGDYIGAEVAADITLYAKWIQVMDAVDLIVTVKHDSLVDSGLASNFNKTLYAQLTYADRNVPKDEQVYLSMNGYSKEYPNGQWHTHGDKVRMDVFEVPSFYTHLSSEYDYSAEVKIAGYYVIEKTVVKTLRPDGSTLHTINVTLQFTPDLFDLSFYVKMADDISVAAYPQSVEVKITSWYDDPAAHTELDWHPITQHEVVNVTVEIDSVTGQGNGTCSVWHWYDEENKIPYHYRMEIIQLNFANGNTVVMNETVDEELYNGGGYSGEIIVEGGSVPEIGNKNPIKTTLAGVAAMPFGDSHIQVGTLGAVIDVNRVVFHKNNEEALDKDVFRTYYPAVSASSKEGHYTLNQDGTISSFYEIPEFDRLTHNKYVFKGWYLDPKGENPVNWSDVYKGTTHIYACWIETGSVEKEEDQKDMAGSTYAGFDLVGVQIKDANVDTGVHYGNAGNGLRFVTVLSEKLYEEINALANGNEAEYGFVVARTSAAKRNANGENYTLQLKGENINGVDTTATHSYVQNFKCSGVEDHYDGDNYRLYTVVITYKNYTGEALEKAYEELYSARSYIAYVDANGLERVYYNNYTGKSFLYGGCSTSFAVVRDMVTK